jgi:hypothetical protein
MAVQYQLSCLAPGFSKTQPEYDVVQAALQELQEILARYSRLLESLLHVPSELAFHDPINISGSLLLSKLYAPVRDSSTAAQMVSRSRTPSFDGATR